VTEKYNPAATTGDKAKPMQSLRRGWHTQSGQVLAIQLQEAREAFVRRLGTGLTTSELGGALCTTNDGEDSRMEPVCEKKLRMNRQDRETEREYGAVELSEVKTEVNPSRGTPFSQDWT
jgi:hypothetical protein